MAEGITQEHFAELRQDIAEAKWLAYSTIAAVRGKEKADLALHSVREFIRKQRFENGTPLFGMFGSSRAASVLFEADIWTLEEAAATGRDQIASLPNIGKVTIDRLDSALAERDLTWAEVA